MKRTGRRLLHTSDLHLGCDSRPGSRWDKGIDNLRAVTGLAAALDVDLLLIAGDMFDNPRVKPALIARAGEILGRSALRTVILPGNHDPHLDGTLYAAHGHLFPENVHILSSGEGETLLLRDLGLQVWGRAHTSYYDSEPLNPPPAWHADDRLWRIAMAHGHYFEGAGDSHRSYLIRDHHLEKAGADYIALGHIDYHTPVGPSSARAYYPGAPELTGGATLVELADPSIAVRHVAFNDHLPDTEGGQKAPILCTSQ